MSKLLMTSLTEVIDMDSVSRMRDGIVVFRQMFGRIFFVSEQKSTGQLWKKRHFFKSFYSQVYNLLTF